MVLNALRSLQMRENSQDVLHEYGNIFVFDHNHFK